MILQIYVRSRQGVRWRPEHRCHRHIHCSPAQPPREGRGRHRRPVPSPASRAYGLPRVACLCAHPHGVNEASIIPSCVPTPSEAQALCSTWRAPNAWATCGWHTPWAPGPYFRRPRCSAAQKSGGLRNTYVSCAQQLSITMLCATVLCITIFRRPGYI